MSFNLLHVTINTQYNILKLCTSWTKMILKIICSFSWIYVDGIELDLKLNQALIFLKKSLELLIL